MLFSSGLRPTSAVSLPAFPAPSSKSMLPLVACMGDHGETLPKPGSELRVASIDSLRNRHRGPSYWPPPSSPKNASESSHQYLEPHIRFDPSQMLHKPTQILTAVNSSCMRGALVCRCPPRFELCTTYDNMVRDHLSDQVTDNIDSHTACAVRSLTASTPGRTMTRALLQPQLLPVAVLRYLWKM